MIALAPWAICMALPHQSGRPRSYRERMVRGAEQQRNGQCRPRCHNVVLALQGGDLLQAESTDTMPRHRSGGDDGFVCRGPCELRAGEAAGEVLMLGYTASEATTGRFTPQDMALYSALTHAQVMQPRRRVTARMVPQKKRLVNWTIW